MTEPTDKQVEVATRVFCNGLPVDSHPRANSIEGRIAKSSCCAPDCLCWEQGKELTRAALAAAFAVGDG
jgi:hypothetical protein